MILYWKKSAQKYIRKQDKITQKRILEALSKLPEVGDIKRLKGLEDYYRLRIGSIRVIYKINNMKLVIVVIDIDNRRQIYKK